MRGWAVSIASLDNPSRPSIVTFRHLLLAAALIAPAACRDTTRPDPSEFRIWTHSLSAMTDAPNSATSSDTVACQLYARVPMPDSITTPWSGEVDVYAWRARPGSARTTANSVMGKALLTVARGAGDSLYVTLQGVVGVSFGGRVDADYYVSAGGDWTCDGRSSLPGTQPGEARGHWFLSPDIPIG
jgi:hypothetical protein